MGASRRMGRVEGLHRAPARGGGEGGPRAAALCEALTTKVIELKGDLKALQAKSGGAAAAGRDTLRQKTLTEFFAARAPCGAPDPAFRFYNL